MAAAVAKTFELKYFNLRGRAEQIRLLLAYTKVKYTDTGVEFKDWPATKPKLPLGQLPVWYETTGTVVEVIPQSQSIMRHLARVHNLYGKNESEMTTADVVADTVLDSRLAFGKAAGSPGAWLSDQKAIEEFYDKAFPGIAKNFDNFLANNKSKSGFLVSDGPTFADFAAFDYLDNVTIVRAASIKDLPRIGAFLDKVRGLDGVKEYIAVRRPTQFSAK